MSKQNAAKRMGAGGFALTGAGVGAAGAGLTVTFMGLSAGLAILPFSLAVGVIGGLAWWALKSLSGKPGGT